MASELLLFQVASVTALVGMTLGWRGVMTRYSGFYDLPTAWSNVFWGILLGGLYSSQVYNIIIVKDIERQLISGESSGFPIVDLILLCLITSILAHFILRRNRVRSGSSQTTSGWALGLAIGGMFGMVTIFAVLRLLSGLNLIITVTMLSIMSPRCEAIISSYQGQLMLMGRKWGAILRATMWRCAFVVMFASVITAPILWVFIVPIALIANKSSETWIWNSIPKEGKKQLRKIWARRARERKMKPLVNTKSQQNYSNESE